MIPLAYPYVTYEMRQAVDKTLQTRWIGQGEKVKELEIEFQKVLQTDTPVAVGAGTDALHLAYMLAGIKKDDEVIVPVFTCTATNFPLLWMGAKLVFADIDPRTLNIDPNDVAAKMTDKTKAIVGVDYAGVSCDWDRLTKMGVTTIDDAAHLKIGNEADFTTYSFQAIKHISTGDGGVLCIKDLNIVDKAKRLRWFGLDREQKLKDIKKWEGDIAEIGYKYQMNDITATLALESLKVLDKQLAFRKELDELYREELDDLGEVRFLRKQEGTNWLMTVLVEDRTNLSEYLDKNGIENSPLHYRNDNYTVFNEYKNDCPAMDMMEDKILCLPLNMKITRNDVRFVCDKIREYYRGS